MASRQPYHSNGRRQVEYNVNFAWCPNQLSLRPVQVRRRPWSTMPPPTARHQTPESAASATRSGPPHSGRTVENHQDVSGVTPHSQREMGVGAPRWVGATPPHRI
jgi:hypothetical protein